MSEYQSWAFSDLETRAIQRVFAQDAWPACPKCGPALESGPPVRVGAIRLVVARCPECGRVLPVALRGADDRPPRNDDRRRDPELRALIDQLLEMTRGLSHHVDVVESLESDRPDPVEVTHRIGAALVERRRA